MSEQSFRDRCAGIQLSWHWLGMTRAVKGRSVEEFAERHNADPKSLSSQQKIFAPGTGPIRNLESIRSKAQTYFDDNTLPYVEVGRRLCRRDRYLDIRNELFRFRDNLKLAELELEEKRTEVIEAAKTFRGDLFVASQYPATFEGCFDLSVEAVNLEPPSYLMQLDPVEYDNARRRLEEKCETARLLYEEQLGRHGLELVDKLVEKMKPDADGRKRRFDNGLLEDLIHFFDKYREMREHAAGIRTENDIDRLVEEAGKVLADLDLEGARASQKVRNSVAGAFETIAEAWGKKVTTSGRRKVEREPGPKQEDEALALAA